jgi:general secretion pathway protein D
MIMCQDNQEASIIVGQSVPFVRGSQVTDAGQVTSQVEYEDIGIQLDVKPHINPDGFVYMEVKPEISQITPSTVNIGNGIVLPIFSKRNAETTVVVKDGETVVIGGLITTTDQETESKVPFLGDVPGLGVLFRTTNIQKNRTELLIVLTPRVVRTVEDGRRLSIESRDITSILTPEMKQSPLMGGLQVTPETDVLPEAEEDLEERTSPLAEPGPAIPPLEPMLPPAPTKNGQPIYGPAAPQYGPVAPADLRAVSYGPVVAPRGSPPPRPEPGKKAPPTPGTARDPLGIRSR